MFVPLSRRRKTPRPTSAATLFETVPPGRIAALAIVGCAAHMACADGSAQPSERAALLAFLRRHGLLTVHGRRTLLGEYDSIAGRPRDTGSHWSNALDRLEALTGMRGAELAATAAAVVAAADGITWPQEIALLRAIRDRLGLGSGSAQLPPQPA